MIAVLQGNIIRKSLDSIVLDVNGVGYQIFLPLTANAELPEIDHELCLQIYTHVREDAIVLFGFINEKERGMFIDLISISGVGPKVALAILSGISSSELENAILDEELARLVAILVIGKKTAERIVLELKGKIEKRIKKDGIARTDKESHLASDVIEALVNLGYERQQAQMVVRTALGKANKEVDEDVAGQKDPGEILKDSLKILSGV